MIRVTITRCEEDGSNAREVEVLVDVIEADPAHGINHEDHSVWVDDLNEPELNDDERDEAIALAEMEVGV